MTQTWVAGLLGCIWILWVVVLLTVAGIGIMSGEGISDRTSRSMLYAILLLAACAALTTVYLMAEVYARVVYGNG